MNKQIGILAHISSLPNENTIGTLGKESFKFVDILAQNNIDIWQILPINPTEKNHSPYSSQCSFAGNISFIDFEEFKQKGLISQEELDSLKRENNEFENQKTKKLKRKLLKKIFKQEQLDEDFENFVEENRFWLDDYALFLTLQKKLKEKCFYKWPDFAMKRDFESEELKEILAKEKKINFSNKK